MVFQFVGKHYGVGHIGRVFFVIRAVFIIDREDRIPVKRAVRNIGWIPAHIAEGQVRPDLEFLSDVLVELESGGNAFIA